MELYARGRNTGHEWSSNVLQNTRRTDMRFSMTSSGRGAQRDLITAVPQSQLELMDLSKWNCILFSSESYSCYFVCLFVFRVKEKPLSPSGTFPPVIG